MKIVNIIGGLGNQMFQYALYLKLCKKYATEEVRICTNAYNGYGLHNAYELDSVFGINAPRATRWEVGRMAYPFANYRQWQICYHLLPGRRGMFRDKVFGHYYEDVLCQKGDCFFDGYWQNENYFSDIRSEILNVFTPKDMDDRNSSIACRLSSLTSVSIHVRHGDFMKSKYYRDICDISYYEKAIKIIREKVNVDVFCIFSNDIAWCEEHIKPLMGSSECIVVDWNVGSQSYKDMYLMSQCKHNIIANSSFSWWGAWLNQHNDKIVISPRKWNNIKKSEFELSSSWIKI